MHSVIDARGVVVYIDMDSTTQDIQRIVEVAAKDGRVDYTSIDGLAFIVGVCGNPIMCGIYADGKIDGQWDRVDDSILNTLGKDVIGAYNNAVAAYAK